MLKTPLLPHQKQTLDWMRPKSGGIVANEMGTGKTLIYLNLALQEHLKTLIIAPKSLLENIRTELTRHFEKIPEYQIHSGRTRQWRDVPLTITSYPIVRMEYPQGRMFQTSFDLIILDEAHEIRNTQTQIAQACQALNGHRRWCFTGTPIINSRQDLLGLQQFTRSPEVFQIHKEEVLHLPPLIEQTIILDKTDDWEQHVRSLQSLSDTLTRILRFKQLCIHPSLVNGSTEIKSSPKFDWILKHLQNQPNIPVVIFSQFAGALVLLHSFLQNNRIKSVLYTGQQSMEQRQKHLQEFQDREDRVDREVQVILMTYKVGGQGLNLTRAQQVIILDPWWNQAIERQAIDRVHRLGQTHEVQVYRLFLKHSIEQWIKGLQDSKVQENRPTELRDLFYEVMSETQS